uniref:Uncharacterized protein n=1 Tax=Oryza sativa subsp. japonica TaxID=39947 RepID=Q2QNU5_ORYSJ|nr:hypothetical protein LOC_Os12g36710 [Oryza sativa Japonica Group]
MASPSPAAWPQRTPDEVEDIITRKILLIDRLSLSDQPAGNPSPFAYLASSFRHAADKACKISTIRDAALRAHLAASIAHLRGLILSYARIVVGNPDTFPSPHNAPHPAAELLVFLLPVAAAVVVATPPSSPQCRQRWRTALRPAGAHVGRVRPQALARLLTPLLLLHLRGERRVLGCLRAIKLFGCAVTHRYNKNGWNGVEGAIKFDDGVEFLNFALFLFGIW